MNKVMGLSVVLGLSATACGSSQETLTHDDIRATLTAAVAYVALTGDTVGLDKRIPCDLNLINGDLVVQKELGPGIAVVEDKYTGKVPRYAIVQCFDNDNGDRKIRGNDGY